MTTRDVFNRRLKWISGLMYFGFALLALGMALAWLDGGQLNIAVVVAGVALFVLAGATGQLLALRCPKCMGNCGPMVFHNGVCRKVSNRLQYCPFCGQSLDEPLQRDEVREEHHV